MQAEPQSPRAPGASLLCVRSACACARLAAAGPVRHPDYAATTEAAHEKSHDAMRSAHLPTHRAHLTRLTRRPMARRVRKLGLRSVDAAAAARTPTEPRVQVLRRDAWDCCLSSALLCSDTFLCSALLCSAAACCGAKRRAPAARTYARTHAHPSCAALPSAALPCLTLPV